MHAGVQECRERAKQWRPNSRNEAGLAELLALFFERYAAALQLWTRLDQNVAGIRCDT